MVCGQTPADCLNCERAVCVWDEPESPKSRTGWTRETYRAFGAALWQARARRKLNQREMAQHLGVTYTSYRAWERGACCPQPSNWRRLVRHIPALASFTPDKPPQLHTQPDDGQEAPGRNGSNG